MEVSQKQSQAQSQTEAGVTAVTDSTAQDGPVGNELIRSISAIAGLGEESVKSQVAEMLSVSGNTHPSNDFSALSLDQLRTAMLAYLETLNADMENAHAEMDQEGSSLDGSSDQSFS